MVPVWVNKKVEKLLRIWYYEVIISLRAETKMKLRHNVCNDATVKEKCDVQCRAERCLLIVILSLMLFWVTDSWQINYTVKMMFCDISDAATVTEQAFSIRSVNNSLSVAWGSKDEVWKGDISLSEKLNKYNCVCI